MSVYSDVLQSNIVLRLCNGYHRANKALEDIMKIVADENLAFTDYFFAEFGEIEHKAGRTLSHADVKDAEALLVRSVTQVNEILTQNTDIKFVGSATIGTDHLDIQALEKQCISWSNAAGCNAQAVSEYVITALLHIQPQLLNKGSDFTLGVIGLGNVGSRLVTMAKLLGWKVIGTDPFVQCTHVEQVEIEQLLSQADAISIHVPLTKQGEHPTYHLINAEALSKMKPKAILINLVTLVTPHIAGYSLEGKARGTQMIYEAFCRTFNHDVNKQFETQLPVCEPFFKDQDLKSVLTSKLAEIYDIAQDDKNLRACLKDGKVDQQAFDHLRKTYPLRREWAAHGGPKA